MKLKNTLLIIMGVCLVAGLLVTGCTQQALQPRLPTVVCPTRSQ